MKIKGVISAAGTALLLVLASGSAQAAFPGENGPIVFDSFNGESSQVYVVEPDGSGLIQLTEPAEGVSNYDPAIGPGSEKIAYTRYDFDSEGPDLSRTQIHLINPDGTGDVRLTDDGLTNHEMPSFSPDGEKIVFSQPGVGADAIATINADGSGLTQLIGDTFALYPAYSPDGSQIAFFGPDGLWLMDADGSDPHMIAVGGLAGPGRPSFSPDGSRIAFYSAQVEDGQTVIDAGIHSIQPDGTDRRIEVPTAVPDLPSFPAYSPDGESLAHVNEFLDFPFTNSPPPRSIRIGDLTLGTAVTVPLELKGMEQIDWGSAPEGRPTCETDSSPCPPPPPTCATDASLCPPPPAAECKMRFTKSRFIVFKGRPVYRLVTRYRSADAGKARVSLYRRDADGSRGASLGSLKRNIESEGTFRITKKVGPKVARKLRHGKSGLIADFRILPREGSCEVAASLALTKKVRVTD